MRRLFIFPVVSVMLTVLSFWLFLNKKCIYHGTRYAQKNHLFCRSLGARFIKVSSLLSPFFYLLPLSLELIFKKCQALHFYVRTFSQVKFNFVATLWAFQLAMLIYWISPQHWPQQESSITLKMNNFEVFLLFVIMVVI